MGHDYLNRNLGIHKVRVAWQIDPFGYSAMTPSLMAKMGYEYFLINRIDQRFKNQLIEEAGLEFIWEGSDLGGDNKILTHILYDHYEYPKAFLQHSKDYCLSGSDEEKIVKNCVSKIRELINKRSKSYKTVNIMLPLGNDFEFENYNKESRVFKLIDLVMSKIYTENLSESEDINMKWSTVSEYFDTVVATKVKLPTYKGDFFPYMTIRDSGSQYYWTGFYSTRPELKREIYESANYIRAAEISSTLVLNERFETRRSAISYHHDGVTGTCRSQVASDYHERLGYDKQKAVETLERVVEEQLKNGVFDLLNDSKYRSIILHNPLNWAREELLNITSPHNNIEILDSRGEPLVTQSYLDPGTESYFIYFYANQPAMSYSVYFILEKSEHCDDCPKKSSKVKGDVISNAFYDISIDRSTGYIKSAKDKSGKSIQFNQKLMSYPGSKSGAYIFMPLNHAKELNDIEVKDLELWEGPLFSAAYVRWERKTMQRGQKYYTQLIILPSKSRGFYWNIDLYVGTNEEVASRFDLNESLSEDWFYTYNSVDVRKRTYVSETSSARIATNYYPILGGLLINSSLEMMIIPKFPVGAGMLSQNSFEFILHRNTAQDDSCGLVQVLNDETTTQHSFYISLGSIDNYSLQKTYHEHRYNTMMFTVSSVKPIKLRISNWQEGKELNGKFNYKTLSTLGINNEGVFIDTILKKEKGRTIYIKNLSRNEQNITLPGLNLGQKQFLNGLSKYTGIVQHQTEGEIVGNHRPGTGSLINIHESYENSSSKGTFKLLGNEITCVLFDIDEHAYKLAKEIYLYTFDSSGTSLLEEALANAQKIDDLINQINEHSTSEVTHSDKPAQPDFSQSPNKDTLPKQPQPEVLQGPTKPSNLQEFEKFLGDLTEPEEESEEIEIDSKIATTQDIETLLYAVILTLSCITIFTLCLYLRSRKRKD